MGWFVWPTLGHRAQWAIRLTYQLAVTIPKSAPEANLKNLGR
jgi:hypothetical protein